METDRVTGNEVGQTLSLTETLETVAYRVTLNRLILAAVLEVKRARTCCTSRNLMCINVDGSKDSTE